MNTHDHDDFELNLLTSISPADLRRKEITEARRDIRNARNALGEFTLRFFTEAVYGDEHAKKMYGEHGGRIKMKDLKVETRNAGKGAVGVSINKDQMRQILSEAHPDADTDEIEMMLEGDPDYKPPAKTLNENDEASELERELMAMSKEERQTILKFMRKVAK